MRALGGEEPGRRLADPAPAADDERDLPFEQSGHPADLAALELPVLELPRLALSEEGEAVDRLGIRDDLHDGAVADRGRRRALRVLPGGDHPDAGDEHHLHPVGERLLGRRAAPLVVGDVLRPELLEPGADLGREVLRGIEAQDEGRLPRAQEVLGRPDPAGSRREELVGREEAEDLLARVHAQDAAAQQPAEHGQQALGRGGRRGRRCPRRP